MPWIRRRFPWIAILVAVLSWEPSPSPSVAGYRVYAGPDYSHLSPVLDAGKVLTIKVPGTEPRCFAVTAYDSKGNESGFTNLVHSGDIDCQDPRVPGQTRNFRFQLR